MDSNPFSGMDSLPIAESAKQTIARADAVMSQANMPTYSDLLDGLFKLKHQSMRFHPVKVAWLQKHITPLFPFSVSASMSTKEFEHADR